MLLTLPPDYRPSETEEFMSSAPGRVFQAKTVALAV